MSVKQGKSYKLQSYGSANWTYDEIDDNSTNANPITGTFKSNGTWSFVSPKGKDDWISDVWENMNRLKFGTLELTYEDQIKLIEEIEKWGDELGKLHFILYR